MKQITEDYCSFETAKLLKEKGFDIPCRQAYFNGSLVDYTLYGFCDGELLDCPSQSLALKWLREVHKIRIHISPLTTFGDKWKIDVITPNKHGVVGDDSQFFPMYNDKYKHTDWWTEFDTYEEAVESALLWSLKNLI